MSNNIGRFDEIQDCLRTLYRLISNPELHNSIEPERRQPAHAAGEADEGSLIVLCIAIPLVCIFFIIWLFRERLLGEDDNPIHVFRETTPRIGRPSTNHGRRQRDTTLPRDQRHLAVDEHSRARQTPSEEVYQLC